MIPVSAVRVVAVIAAGVVPPITELSMVPPEMIPVSAVSVVAVIAAGVVPPITELFMVAPDRVMSSGTYESAIAVPCHSPVVMVPTSSIADSFPVVMIVPVTFGKVIVLSTTVGSSTASIVS